MTTRRLADDEGCRGAGRRLHQHGELRPQRLRAGGRRAPGPRAGRGGTAQLHAQRVGAEPQATGPRPRSAWWSRISRTSSSRCWPRGWSGPRRPGTSSSSCAHPRSPGTRSRLTRPSAAEPAPRRRHLPHRGGRTAGVPARAHPARPGRPRRRADPWLRPAVGRLRRSEGRAGDRGARARRRPPAARDHRRAARPLDRPSNVSPGTARAIAATGADPDATPVLVGDYHQESGTTLAARALSGPARTRPTALLCANDLMAIGALEHCKAAGPRGPGRRERRRVRRPPGREPAHPAADDRCGSRPVTWGIPRRRCCSTSSTDRRLKTTTPRPPHQPRSRPPCRSGTRWGPPAAAPMTGPDLDAPSVVVVGGAERRPGRDDRQAARPGRDGRRAGARAARRRARGRTRLSPAARVGARVHLVAAVGGRRRRPGRRPGARGGRRGLHRRRPSARGSVPAPR